MGGGDLNSKKSWHPNNLKNQEGVRKAEEMTAFEKKRIKELQHQYDEERDREELNRKIKSNSGATNDNRLHWMYDKPDKGAQHEDYLLGKAIDKHSESHKVEDDAIPAVARRVVGSSMMTSSDDTQVDLVRKIREDPLLLVKERERAARAALLNNPLHRRKLAQLLRQEQDQTKDSKSKKKSKRKEKDLDDVLAAKLSAISGSKGIDLKSLLDSDDSSDSSDESTKKKKYKKKKKKKKLKKKRRSSSDREEESKDRNVKRNSKEENGFNTQEKDKKRKYEAKNVESKEGEYKEKRHKRDESSTERCNSQSYRSKYQRDTHERSDSRRGRSSQSGDRGKREEERAARLAEMAAAGAERERERGRRVAHGRERDAASEAAPAPRAGGSREARLLPATLAARIHSNRQYIQRDGRHMSEHFARR